MLSVCTAVLVVPSDFSEGVVVFLDIYRNVELLPFFPSQKVPSLALGVSTLVSSVPKQQTAAFLPL